MIDGVDKALLSRLHFQIHFDDLGYDQRLALWKSSLSLVKGLDLGKLEKVAKGYEVNGHEVSHIGPQILFKMSEAANTDPMKIKNAVSCAKMMSQSRGTTLTADLLKEILVELSPRCSNVKDTQSLPVAFDEISKSRLLSQSALEDARAQWGTQNAATTGNGVFKSLTSGKEKVLAKISKGNGKAEKTEEISLKASDLRENGYSFHNTACYGNVKMLSAGGSTHWLEDLMCGVLDDSLCLGANQVNKINQELVAVEVEPSGGKSKLASGITLIYAGSGDFNLHLGNGDMFNVYSGGVVNKAKHMSVGKSPVSVW